MSGSYDDLDDSDFSDSDYSDDEDFSDDEEWAQQSQNQPSSLFQKVDIACVAAPRQQPQGNRSLLSAALRGSSTSPTQDVVPTGDLRRTKPSRMRCLNDMGRIGDEDSGMDEGDEGVEMVGSVGSVGSGRTICGGASPPRPVPQQRQQQQRPQQAQPDPCQTELTDSLRQNLAWDRRMPFNTRLNRVSGNAWAES
ncbi:hypothetical protein HK104_002384 [Borealophlyctis nickersoniae]|nr:hypothetical protein HK104_002384 [Borealophlyctis nickersoniae]